MRGFGWAALFALCLTSLAWAEDLDGKGPLRSWPLNTLRLHVPSDVHLMTERSAVEALLSALDDRPPDWATVYGRGHHDSGHDDRLFALNRERDARREGRPALSWPVAFLWSGTLSAYDAEAGGYPVALGPKFIRTSWGLVRFKPEEAPGNLVAVPDAGQRTRIQALMAKGGSVEIEVLMIGRLIPNESLVYDFSHDEDGLGLIMPFVQVERVELILPPSKPPRT
jgi:hypothetical protein